MKTVFVSHIHEEAALARKLKDWVEDAFLGQCEVFVSSDRRSLVPGARWLEEIDEALSSAAVFIVLCSPSSIQRPWVNFETGAGWVKQVPVVPICHSGLARSALPLPLSAFQALELEATDFVPSLLTALARHLAFPRAPRVDAGAMHRDLLQEALKITPSQPVATPTQSASDLPSECVEILSVLAEADDSPDAAQLAHQFKISVEKMKYFLDLLKDRSLINYHLYVGSPATYYLTKEGRRFLVDLGRL